MRIEIYSVMEAINPKLVAANDHGLPLGWEVVTSQPIAKVT